MFKKFVCFILIGVFGFIFLISFPPISSLASASDWQVSEVLANPENEQTGEFVEVWYGGIEEFDLSGVTISDSKQTDLLVDYVGEHDLGKRGLEVVTDDVILIVDRDYEGQYNQWLMNEVDLSSVVMLTTKDGNIGNGLNNTGDMIVADNSVGEMLFNYSWDSDSKNGFSWENIGGQWLVSDMLFGNSFGVVRFEKMSSTNVEGDDNEDKNEDQYIFLSSVDQIKDGDAGDMVQFEGVVSVDYSILEDHYLWVMDDTGGVGLRANDDPGCEIGDKVFVEGFIRDLTYHRVVVVDELEKVGSDGLPLEKVSADNWKNFEDQVVKMEGVVAEIDSNSWYLDSGGERIRVYIKDSVDMQGVQVEVGQKIVVTGLVNQIKSGYRLLPRGMADVIILSDEQNLLLPSVGFDYSFLWKKIVNMFVSFRRVLNRPWNMVDGVAGG